MFLEWSFSSYILRYIVCPSWGYPGRMSGQVLAPAKQRSGQVILALQAESRFIRPKFS